MDFSRNLRELCQWIGSTKAALFFPEGNDNTAVEKYHQDESFRKELLGDFQKLADELYKNHNLEDRVFKEILFWIINPKAAMQRWTAATEKAVPRQPNCNIH
jgi:TRAP-type mannitol/chloroaromatic compound transport system substrate-binding protein